MPNEPPPNDPAAKDTSDADPSKVPPAKDPSDKDRADLYIKLANQAWLRFNSRRDVEWKMSVAIWSLFTAGTVGVFASSSPVHPLAFFLAAVFVGLLLWVFWWFWLPQLNERMQLDRQTSYFWEGKAQQLLGVPLPAHLAPETNASGAEDKTNASGAKEKWYSRPFKLHISQWCQLALAALFAALFLSGLCFKAFANPAGPPSHLTFEAESANKIKLSH